MPMRSSRVPPGPITDKTSDVLAAAFVWLFFLAFTVVLIGWTWVLLVGFSRVAGRIFGAAA